MQGRLKRSVEDLLVVQLKARFPFKPDDNIRSILTQKLDGKDPLLDEECHAITTYMYNDQDAAIILDAVSVLRCGSQCSGQLCVSFLPLCCQGFASALVRLSLCCGRVTCVHCGYDRLSLLWRVRST